MHRRLVVVLVAFVLVVAACTGSGDDDDAAEPAPSTSSSGGSTSTTRGSVDIDDVAVEEGPNSVLSAVLTFTTSSRTVPIVGVRGAGESFIVPSTDAATDHEIPIVGLQPETEYEVTVGALGAEDPVVENFTTGALPEGMPRFEVVQHDDEAMAQGVTLFDAIPLAQPDPATTTAEDDPQLGWAIAVDAEGNVVWYYHADQPIGDVRQLGNGDLLVEYGNLGVREIDVLGNTVRQWFGTLARGRLANDRFGRPIVDGDAIPVDVDSLHHEIGFLPNGHLLALSTELVQRDFPAPRCGEDPATFSGSYQLISDVVVEFDADSGEVVNRWPLTDYLDPVNDVAQEAVCSPTSASAVPTFMYAALGDVKDWSHSNSVVLDQERNALLVSVRHLNAVLAIDYDTGDLLWRLGPGGTLQMQGDGRFQYHQHALHVLDGGDLMLYDNGNERPGGPPQSRAVRYHIDDAAGTVTQEWEYLSTVDDQPAFAFFVGDADLLANDDILIDNGGLTSDASDVSAQVLEVVPSDGPSGGQPVWEMQVFDDGPDWAVYRAERVLSIYGP